jgi:hypothetical protein
LHKEVENLAFIVNRRQSQNCVPAIITAISSKCHLDVGRGRRRRSYRANNGPNFNAHNRVPWRGVTGRGLDPTISGIGRIGQITMAGNPTAGSSLKCAHGFQYHISSALDGPFVVLFQEDGADQPCDRRVVWEDADDIGPAFDLAVEPFEAYHGFPSSPFAAS